MAIGNGSFILMLIHVKNKKIVLQKFFIYYNNLVRKLKNAKNSKNNL